MRAGLAMIPTASAGMAPQSDSLTSLTPGEREHLPHSQVDTKRREFSVRRPSRFGLAFVFVLCCCSIAIAQTANVNGGESEGTPPQDAVAEPRATTDSALHGSSTATDSSALLKKLDQLIDKNQQLEQQTQKLQEENRELLEQIRAIRQSLGEGTNENMDAPSRAESRDLKTPEPASTLPKASTPTGNRGNEPGGTAQAAQEQESRWGRYTPNQGYKVAQTEHGDLSVSIYTYARYLNQRALDNTYVDGLGIVKSVQQRQDVQLTKVQIKFLGWLLSPKFRYFLYGWTNNAAQGLPAQVVLAGNLNYQFNKYVTFSGGITSLPGVRSTEGNFPFWLGVDARHIADEFFRPSYTTGLWLRGNLTNHLRYQAMVGNNLSTLGVSAAQLNNKFNTFAGAVVWTSTPSDKFGPGFGDFENHEKLAARLGAHFTRSEESKESQPNSDSFENTQLRLSNGSIIFTPNLFGQGVVVNEARYRMSSFDGALKYRGMALEGEYYLRWLDNFKGPNVAVVPDLFDHGFQLQSSAMVVPKTLQLYLGTSKIFGQYGNPYDVRFGTNWYVFKNRVVRWNSEALYLYKSPVGYTAVPFALGGKGWVFHSTVEMAF